jgi:hypothetical protein
VLGKEHPSTIVIQSNVATYYKEKLKDGKKILK